MRSISALAAILLLCGCKSEPPTIIENFVEYIDGYTIGFEVDPVGNRVKEVYKIQYLEGGTSIFVFNAPLAPNLTCQPGTWEVKNGKLCERTPTLVLDPNRNEGRYIWEVRDWSDERCVNIAESSSGFSIPERGTFIWRTDEQLTCDVKINVD